MLQQVLFFLPRQEYTLTARHPRRHEPLCIACIEKSASNLEARLWTTSGWTICPEFCWLSVRLLLEAIDNLQVRQKGKAGESLGSTVAGHSQEL
jgi:hypothetical protein